MRYKQLLSEQQLDELRMSPSSLRAFAASPEAQGIQAGFEAELVFTGLGGDGDDDYDMEPDMDADERCRSIQQVIEFFENDDYGYGIHGREADRLQEGLDEKYYEWYDEQMYEQFREQASELIKDVLEEDFDKEEFIREYIQDHYGDGIDPITPESAFEASRQAPRFTNSREQAEYMERNPAFAAYVEADEAADSDLEERAEESFENQDGNYDAALDNFRDGFYIDDDSRFFTDVGLRWMSDVQEEFSLMWPIMTGTGSSDGGFSQDNAERLADDLHEKLGVQTKVSGGYHSATRKPGLWIFEPDSSLDADDSDNMPVEIVSPPMPLEECLAKMEQFFEWAESNGAYANSSTGFHMGVSLPYRGGAVDYVKLALFLGDEHVLKSFGRSSNTYCAAAIKKIRDRVKGNKEAVGNAMELMRNNLLELAQKALEINNHGFGKYTSINPQGGNDNTRPDKERGAKYIEFRSAGGSNYFEDIDKLKNTLLRYAKAMQVAGDPAAERREYYKKLYKLIAPSTGDSSLDLFARFATGEISSEELKKTWAEKALEKDAPELVQKGDWIVIDQGTGRPVTGQEYRGFSRSEARARAKQKISPGSSDEGFDMGYDIVPMETGKWEIYTKNPDTGEENTLEIVDAERKGEAVDKVYDKYVSQDIPFFARAYYGGEKAPAPKLTRRAELAKNIKNAPAEPVKNWKVYDTKTGEVHYEQEGRKSSLVQIMRKFERDHKLPQGRLAIQEIPTEKEPVVDQDNLPHTWEFYYAPTGRVLDRVSDISASQARAVLGDTIRRYDDLDSNQIRMRTMPTDASQQRYNDRQELNPVTDQQPQQATASNGVPLWQVYERTSGRPVHEFADHDQTSAWATAQAWLRDIGAEDPSKFSCRPKLNTTNESKAARIWESILDDIVKPVKRLI